VVVALLAVLLVVSYTPPRLTRYRTRHQRPHRHPLRRHRTRRVLLANLPLFLTLRAALTTSQSSATYLSSPSYSSCLTRYRPRRRCPHRHLTIDIFLAMVLVTSYCTTSRYPVTLRAALTTSRSSPIYWSPLTRYRTSRVILHHFPMFLIH
jgi:hypothetical protein